LSLVALREDDSIILRRASSLQGPAEPESAEYRDEFPALHPAILGQTANAAYPRSGYHGRRGR
jgi:hypothetical protein